LPLNGSLDFCSPTLIGGWAWDSSQPANRVDIEVVANGEVVGRTTANSWRYDLKARGIGDGCHAYWFSSPTPLDGAFIEARVAESTHSLTRNQEAIPLPDGDLLSLVVGGRDGREFLETGAYDLNTIRNLLAEAGLSWQARKEPKVLDWGCGCGRIARHWQGYAGQLELFGTDIDDRLIDWCNKNLKFGSFAVSGLRPPLAFPDAHFDAVYAISVLTHLLFDTHYLWMAEIWRILKPDGIAVLTAHGPSVFPTSVNHIKSAGSGRTGLTLVDEEMFFEIEQVEGSGLTANVETYGMFERIFSPFRILKHTPRSGLMGIQDVYVVAKRSQGPLSLTPSLADCEMRGTEFEASFEINLSGQRRLTLLAGAPGLVWPATVQLAVDLPDRSIPPAKSKVVPLPERVSWSRLQGAYAGIAINDIPAWQGTAVLRCSVNASKPMEAVKLQLRNCALF